MQRIMGNISVEQNDPCLFRLAATFSSDQIDCICEALYQARDGAKLLELFQPNVHNVMFYRCRYYSSSVLRAYLYALYYSKRYEELFQTIASNTFEQRFYSELQDLWYKARYAEILRQFYRKNKYPTLEDKKEIARITDLKIIQISNWFKNRRQRDKSSSTGQFSSAVPLQFDNFNL
ncbi:homeobox domain protein [Onchocerca flexuosa]|uniref:Homeobox domain protein n=1 Tax=Onchocerca flexuosa TaxID=387005 RepID=A0A238BZQ6_9BILA|nr:homeobox domain protein [Onchocerca flexuosa]